MRIIGWIGGLFSAILANAVTPIVVAVATSTAVTTWAAYVYDLDPPVLVAVALSCVGGALALGRSMRDGYRTIARPKLHRLELDGILWVEVMDYDREKPRAVLEARCKDHRLPLRDRDSDGYLRSVSFGGTQNLWCPYGDMSEGHAVTMVAASASRPYEIAYNRAESYMRKKKDPR